MTEENSEQAPAELLPADDREAGVIERVPAPGSIASAWLDRAKVIGKEKRAAAAALWLAGTPPPDDPRWVLWAEVKGTEVHYCAGGGEFKNGKNTCLTMDKLARRFVTTRQVRRDKTTEELQAAIERHAARGGKGRAPTAANKDGPWISAAVLRDDCPAPNQFTDKDGVKNLCNTNVLGVGRVFLADLDDVTAEQLDVILARLRNRQLAFSIYTSHSHRAGKIKVRIILYTDQEMAADSEDARELIKVTRQMIGRDLFMSVDPAHEDGLEDPSRWNAAGLMFMPSHNGGEEAVAAAFNRFEPGGLLELKTHIDHARLMIAQERAGVGTKASGDVDGVQASDKLAKRIAHRDSIREGKNIHPSMIALAPMLWFDGWKREAIVEYLEDAMYHCQGKIEDSRWQERFDNIETIVDDQEKFARKSEFFEPKMEQREKIAQEREARAQAAHEKAEQEKARKGTADTELSKIEADIANLQRGQLQEAGKLVERLGALLLDPVANDVRLTKIVEALKPEGAGVGATEKVRKTLAAVLKETRRAAKAGKAAQEREAKAAARARAADDKDKAETAEGIKRAAAYEATAKKLTARFKYVLEPDAFYDDVTRGLRPVKAVYNSIFADLPLTEKGARVDPRTVMLADPATMYDRMTYRADQPAEYADENGLRCLNTYRPTSLVPIEGDASVILNHIDRLFGGRDVERDHFLDTIAYKVQNPWAKITHALLIGSRPGGGKGTIAKPLRAIFGEDNFVEPDNQEITDGRMGFFERKTCVVVHEFRIPGGSDRRDVIGLFKPAISEDSIRIKVLYMNPYRIDCRALLICFTNYPDEVHVEPGDRRWWLFKSKVAAFDSPEASAAYFGPIHKWLDGDGTAIFYNYLLKRDVRGFDPYMNAPETPEKVANEDNSKGEVQNKLAEWYADRDAPFAVDLINLDRALDGIREKVKPQKCSLAVLKTFLRDQGGQPLGEGSTRFKLHDTYDGARARLWVIRGDVDRWTGADAQAAIGRELMRGGWPFARVG